MNDILGQFFDSRHIWDFVGETGLCSTKILKIQRCQDMYLGVFNVSDFKATLRELIIKMQKQGVPDSRRPGEALGRTFLKTPQEIW